MKTMFLVSAVLLAACGGGGSDPDAPPINRPDMRMTPDAPSICTLEAAITDVPSTTAPNDNSAVLRSVSGATPPEDIFLWNFVIAGTGTLPDLFQFSMPRPDVANVGTGPLLLRAACTAAVDYCMVGLGDFDTGTGMETQFFYANTGSITITQADNTVPGSFIVSMEGDAENPGGPRWDHSMPDGTIIPGCSATMNLFAAQTLDVTDPTFAPNMGPRFAGDGKWGQYTRE